jgi:hypothetical protein
MNPVVPVLQGTSLSLLFHVMIRDPICPILWDSHGFMSFKKLLSVSCKIQTLAPNVPDVSKS